MWMFMVSDHIFIPIKGANNCEWQVAGGGLLWSFVVGRQYFSPAPLRPVGVSL
jgi:hypothetical protein